ncbi:MAG: sugar kinase [Leptolyngbya sp. SIO4C1]|nr:sugar kinase [Leptolyngbya sp. SIO4C1]
MKQGLFVGLMTLDYLYQAEHPPAANEKVVALQAAVAAGGPATNAAVAFSQLGGQATVMGKLGQHPIASLIKADLAQWQVEVNDLATGQDLPPPVSSIVVTQATGDRAVISHNAVGRQAEAPNLAELACDVVLIDGHQMQVGSAIAALARSQHIPVVVDAGSWKPGFEQVLTQADVVIASASFQPPDRSKPMAYLESLDIPQIAITHGAQPVIVSHRGIRSQLLVPSAAVVDTLGAGDIFHGAFCWFYPEQSFTAALAAAGRVAAFACQFFGTRAWITPYHRQIGHKD